MSKLLCKLAVVLATAGWLSSPAAAMMRGAASGILAASNAVELQEQAGYRGCGGRRACLYRCPDRYSCSPLYGGYGPYGGAAYWGAYTWQWNPRR